MVAEGLSGLTGDRNQEQPWPALHVRTNHGHVEVRVVIQSMTAPAVSSLARVSEHPHMIT